MPPSESVSRDEAVVIGGSIAGLFAAHVLADHFGHVTVIERDRFPARPEFRGGVPQSRHLHILLGRGLDISERFFPGIVEELVDAGAIPLEWPTDAVLLGSRGWTKRFAPGLQFISCSRELLEWTVRRHVAGRANVEFTEGREVTGLLKNADRKTVNGVLFRTRRPRGEPGAADEFPAALVVDASGRHSKLPEWLTALGYERPQEERVNAFIGYASRDYAIPPEFEGDWKAVMLFAKPPSTRRTGYLFQIAPGRWRLSVMGAESDYPPTDEDGFLAFVGGLRSPMIAEAIASAEPLTPIFSYRATENQRRFYERLRRFPGGLLAMGDSVAAFDPIYGQGMTAAAQAALALDRLLRARAGGEITELGQRFHRAIARANTAAWLIAAGGDLRYSQTEGGRRDLMTRLTHRYLDRVFRAAADSRRAHFALANVIQLLDPPIALFKPAVLVPALLRGGRPDQAIPPERPSRDRAAVRAAPRPSRQDETGTPSSPSTSRPLRTGKVSVAAVRSPIIEAGPERAEEAVVFVHGNPGSSLDWVELVRAVGAFGRAVALDMPGFGRADKPHDFDYTVDGYARHLGGALGDLGVRRAHLVLHDFGGPWGLTWAIAHPEAFASVTLINIGLLLDYRWHYLARIWRMPLVGELFMATATRPGFRLLLKHGNPRGLPRPMVDRMFDDFDAGTRRAVLRLYRATDKPAEKALPMADALRRLRRPALVVWGKHDPYLPVTLAERQREVFADAQVVVLEGSGHWPFADDPEQVAGVVVPFLRRVMNRDAAGEPKPAMPERSKGQGPRS
jgi:pimeloyl-ACP methyl ester carboxylesterase/flavin-dependent dehydrogenase